MKILHGKIFKIVIVSSLASSLILNLSLLKSSNKLNLDSLKWTIKSQFVNLSDMQNGKIPLIKHPGREIDYQEFTKNNSMESRETLIKEIGKYFSIFGLGNGEGFSGLPKGLPKRIAKCAVKNGLNTRLYFTDLGTFGSQKAYVFYQGDIQTNSLNGSLLTEENCSVKNIYRIQKSVTSWVLSTKSSANFKPDQLPAHAALDSTDQVILLNRLGQLCTYGLGITSNATVDCVKTSLDFSKSIKNTHFGVKSILIDGNKLYVAYAINNLNCARLEIKRLNFSGKFKVEQSSKLLYKSPGCFNPETTELNAIGGRMIFSNQQKSQITFSLGNAEIWTGLETIIPNSNYGKIMNISLTTGRITDISSGHRNPQGLCYLENQLYSSEQGPDGGDELNAIVRGKDYGWPAVSYGMPYGEFVSNRVKGRNFASHEGYEKPLISWAPAIAAGDLICPNSRVKGAWTRNFLLATLKDSSIRRLVLDSGAIRVDERIPLGFRIRDILITKSGQLLALTDEGSVIQIKLIDR